MPLIKAGNLFSITPALIWISDPSFTEEMICGLSKDSTLQPNQIPCGLLKTNFFF